MCYSFHIRRLCIFSTQCICVFRLILTINSNYFPHSTEPWVSAMKSLYVYCEAGTPFQSYLVGAKMIVTGIPNNLQVNCVELNVM